MKQLHHLTWFAGGVVVAAGLTAFGHTKVYGQQTFPIWDEQWIDEGPIRSNNFAQVPHESVLLQQVQKESQFASASPQAQKEEARRRYALLIAQADTNTRTEVQSKMRQLLGLGYEPYAATVYNGIYKNEIVSFFRRRVR